MENENKCDYQLGLKVKSYLETKGVETPMRIDMSTNTVNIGVMAMHMADILNVCGLDLTDDSLKDTPTRVAKMYATELYWGLDYRKFPKCTTVDNKMQYDEMVLEKGITVMSDCEHHLRPIVGKAHVAYIPNKKVLGLSKLNRIVDFFSRRPQIQERLTEQIYYALSYVLETEDVAVVIDAEHFCVKQRGIQHTNCSTVTSKLGGKFMKEHELRHEFMSLIKN